MYLSVKNSMPSISITCQSQTCSGLFPATSLVYCTTNPTSPETCTPSVLHIINITSPIPQKSNATTGSPRPLHRPLRSSRRPAPPNLAQQPPSARRLRTRTKPAPLLRRQRQHIPKPLRDIAFAPPHYRQCFHHRQHGPRGRRARGGRGEAAAETTWAPSR